MPDIILALGAYEKAVLLELHNSLSLQEIQSIKVTDCNFRLLFSIIHNSWEQQQRVSKCIEKIHMVFTPTLYSCVPVRA